MLGWGEHSGPVPPEARHRRYTIHSQCFLGVELLKIKYVLYNRGLCFVAIELLTTNLGPLGS